MKLTVENLKSVKEKTCFVIFVMGKLTTIMDVLPHVQKVLTVQGSGVPYKEYVGRLTAGVDYQIFPVSEIRMPCTKTAEIADKLSEIEPTDKRCIAWFNSVEDEKLRAALLAEMDGDLATSRNAINLLDAMEQGLFIDEETENGKYLRRVMANLKALQA